MNGTWRAVWTVALTAGLSGAAQASEIKITTDPSGAAVQLNGVSHGPSPVTIPKVPRGSYTLKVSLDGYVTREDVIDVDGDSDFQIHAPLNPAPKPPPPEPPRPSPRPAQPAPQPQPQPVYHPPTPAPPPPPPVEARTVPATQPAPRKSLVLLVETVPNQAFVQVVGLDENKRSPATFTGFAPGTVQLLVRAPGYKDKKVEVDLKHDARTRVVLDPL